MKMKKLVALAASITMIAATPVFAEETETSTAATVVVEHIAFNDFEGYDVGYELNKDDDGVYYGVEKASSSVTVDVADVVSIEGNKCIETFSSPAYRTEMKIDIDNTAPSESFVAGISMYFDSITSGSNITIRMNGKVYTIAKISDGRKLILGSTNTGFQFYLDRWYDFIFEVNTVDGTITAYIDGLGSAGKYTGTITPGEDTKNEKRWTFVIDKESTSGETKIYLDNIFLYSGNKTTTAAYTERYFDFENIVLNNGSTSPASNVEVYNPKHIDIAKASDGLGGSCVAMAHKATGYPGMRLILNNTGIQGKSVLEFDYKFDDSSRMTFGLRGTSSTGKTNQTQSLFSIDANGAIKANGRNADNTAVEATTLTEVPVPGVWYHFVINIDSDSKTWSMKATSPGKNDITYSNKLSTEAGDTDVLIVKGVQIGTAGKYVFTDYIDNVILKEGNTAFKLLSKSLEANKITKNTKKITFNFNGDILSNAADYLFKVNGEEVTAEIYGSTAFITLADSVETSDFFYVEASVVDNVGNSAYGVKTFAVVKDMLVYDFAYDTEAAEGTIGASAKILSNCEDCTSAVLITAIYDATTNEYITLTTDSAELTVGTASTLTTSLTIPEGYTNVKAVSFIWKGLTNSIVPVCKPLPLQ